MVVSCVLLTLSTGSVIIFEATPDVIKTGITSSITIRCNLDDTTTGSDVSLIGRDVSATLDNIHQLSSIVLMRNGVDIASMTQVFPARALNTSSKLQVTGDLNQRFIEITVDYPSDSMSGEYFCEINAVNDVGHAVVFTKSLEIGAQKPTFDDLIDEIRKLRIEKESEKQLINQRIDRLNHTETGRIVCGHSNTWTLLNIPDNHKVVDVTQQFQRPYDHIPEVKAGIVFLDHWNDENIRISTSIKNVTENSVTIRCETWHGSTVHNVAVTWISVPK